MLEARHTALGHSLGRDVLLASMLALRHEPGRDPLPCSLADPLNTGHHVVKIMGDWRSFLREGVSDEDEGLERHVSTGRPLAEAAFVDQLERRLGATSTGAKAAGPKAYHAPKDELADAMAVDVLSPESS